MKLGFKDKIIRRFPKAGLYACADKAHREGCYIQLAKDKVTCSVEQRVLLDLNVKGEIVGIDLL